MLPFSLAKSALRAGQKVTTLVFRAHPKPPTRQPEQPQLPRPPHPASRSVPQTIRQPHTSSVIVRNKYTQNKTHIFFVTSFCRFCHYGPVPLKNWLKAQGFPSPVCTKKVSDGPFRCTLLSFSLFYSTLFGFTSLCSSIQVFQDLCKKPQLGQRQMLSQKKKSNFGGFSSIRLIKGVK